MTPRRRWRTSTVRTVIAGKDHNRPASGIRSSELYRSKSFPRSRQVPVRTDGVDDLTRRGRMGERVRGITNLDNGLIAAGVGLIGFPVVVRVVRNNNQLARWACTRESKPTQISSRR